MVNSPDLFSSKFGRSLVFNYTISKVFLLLSITHLIIKSSLSSQHIKSEACFAIWLIIFMIQYKSQDFKPKYTHHHLLSNISVEWMTKCPDHIIMKLYKYNVFGIGDVSFENFTAIIFTSVFIMIDSFTESIVDRTPVRLIVFSLDLLLKTVILLHCVQSMMIVKALMLTSTVILHSLIFSFYSNIMPYILYLLLNLSFLAFFLLYFYIMKKHTLGKFIREFNIQNSFFITDNQFNLITYADSDDFFLKDFEELFTNEKLDVNNNFEDKQFDNMEKDNPLQFMVMITQSYFRKIMLGSFKYFDRNKTKNSNKLSCLMLFLLDSTVFRHDLPYISPEENENIKVLIKEYDSIKKEIQEMLTFLGASKEVATPFYLFLSVNELLTRLSNDSVISKSISSNDISRRFSLFLSKINSIVKRFHHFISSTLSSKKSSLSLGSFYYRKRVYWIKITAVDFDKYFEYFDLSNSFSPLTQQLYITRVYSELIDECIMFNSYNPIDHQISYTSDNQAIFSYEACIRKGSNQISQADLALQLSKIIHDFKNPLQLIHTVSSSLSVSLQGVLHSANAEMQSNAEDLEMLKSQSEYILILTEELNDFAKSLRGKQANSGVVLKSCNIRQVLISCYEIYKYKQKNDSNKNNLNIVLEVNDNVPSQISTDVTKLKQIIINLMSNSYKFTNRGYLKLSADISNKGASLKIEIEDTGLGMTIEELEALSAPFKMIERHKLMNYHGSGLGISIVKEILAKLNSELKVKSELNKGTFFWFELPIIGSKDSFERMKSIPNVKGVSNKLINEVNKSLLNITLDDVDASKRLPTSPEKIYINIINDDDSATQPINSFYSHFDIQKINKSFSINSGNSEDVMNNIMESSMNLRKNDGIEDSSKSQFFKDGGSAIRPDQELNSSPTRDVKPKSKLSKKYLIKGGSNENFFTILEQEKENEIELPDHSTALEDSICFEELTGRLLF